MKTRRQLAAAAAAVLLAAFGAAHAAAGAGNSDPVPHASRSQTLAPPGEVPAIPSVRFDGALPDLADASRAPRRRAGHRKGDPAPASATVSGDREFSPRRGKPSGATPSEGAAPASAPGPSHGGGTPRRSAGPADSGEGQDGSGTAPAPAATPAPTATPTQPEPVDPGEEEIEESAETEEGVE